MLVGSSNRAPSIAVCRNQARLTSIIKSSSASITSRMASIRSISSFNGNPAYLGLERAMALRLELLNLILDLRDGLAVAVIRTSHVIWDRVAIAAEQAIERSVGG